MPIEKVFAIQAPAEAVWRALVAEVESAEAGARIERSEPPRLLSLRVDAAGVPAVVTYTITPVTGYTEVSAQMEPMGFRYLLFQALTFGRFRTGFELLLVQGLSNLKLAVEGG